MFSKILLLASLAVTAVFADPVPSAPGPGDVYNQGSQCKIEWTPDTTGAWKTMNIELMTGANLNMKHLTTVTTVDGTTTSSYSWTCPGVVPNSAIYFYQFTSPASNTTLWTTRFGIASTDGHLDPPSESTQPGSGDAIPWGNGALADPSSATPPPSGVNTNSTSSGGVAVSGSASAAASGVSVTPTQSVVSLSSTPAAAASGFATSSGSARASGATGSGSAAAASGSKSSASASPSGGAAAANAAVGGAEGGLVKVAVALAGVGAAFAVVL